MLDVATLPVVAGVTTRRLVLGCVLLLSFARPAAANLLRTPPLWANNNDQVTCTVLNTNNTLNRHGTPTKVWLIGPGVPRDSQDKIRAHTCSGYAPLPHWAVCSFTVTVNADGPVVCSVDAYGLAQDRVQATLSVGCFATTLRREG